MEDGPIIEEDNQDQILQYKVREEIKFTASISNKDLKYIGQQDQLEFAINR